MKILFLANRIPYPPYRGDKLKIYNLAKRLSGRHELYLLTFTETEADKEYRAELEGIFKEVHLVHLPKWRSALNCLSGIFSDIPFQVLYFRSAEMTRTLNMLLQSHKFDVVHVQHLRMSPYLAQKKGLPRILDLPDAFSLYWDRRKQVHRGVLTAAFENREQQRVLKFERILKEYDRSLVCSHEDLDYLAGHLHADNLRLLPNGVDLDTFAFRGHDYSHNHTLLFTGNMDYAPNVDAVVYFVQDILPLIHRVFPATRLVIAGQKPVRKVLDLAGDRVSVTGFVKDIAAVYNEASVVVAPLRFGAGTQNKVLEALAMGIPVVCSNIGFEGLDLESGEGAIMQTDKNGFAGAVCELLASAELRERTGRKGMEIVTSRFSWDVIAGLLESYFEEIA